MQQKKMLAEHIAETLNLTTPEEISCVNTIFEQAMILDLLKGRELSESKLQMFTTIISSFINELLQASENPEKYEQTLNELLATRQISIA
jgi:hypothetical protein